MNGPIPLCSKCKTWHSASEKCPAGQAHLTPAEIAADADEEVARLAFEAKRKGKPK